MCLAETKTTGSLLLPKGYQEIQIQVRRKWHTVTDQLHDLQYSQYVEQKHSLTALSVGFSTGSATASVWSTTPINSTQLRIKAYKSVHCNRTAQVRQLINRDRCRKKLFSSMYLKKKALACSRENWIVITLITIYSAQWPCWHQISHPPCGDLHHSEEIKYPRHDSHV